MDTDKKFITKQSWTGDKNNMYGNNNLPSTTSHTSIIDRNMKKGEPQNKAIEIQNNFEIDDSIGSSYKKKDFMVTDNKKKNFKNKEQYDSEYLSPENDHAFNNPRSKSPN